MATGGGNSNQSADARFRILSRLNLVAEFQSMGVEFTRPTPNANGWLECRSRGRQDERNPSAACNVSGDGSVLGRYKDSGAGGGAGDSCSFWDFCLRHGNFSDFKTLHKHYADKVGEKIGRGRRKQDLRDALEFLPWNDSLVSWWLASKPGVTMEAVKLAGCQVAAYPKKSKQYQVLAMPVYGPQLLDGDPVGYVLWNLAGGDLPVWGTPGPGSQVKMKSIGETGLANLFAVARLSAMRDAAESGGEVPALSIYKVEGPTDLMALQALIPPELSETNLVVTNTGGSMQCVSLDMAKCFANCRVFVLHDADAPGQLGAAKWTDALSHIARQVVNVSLPYPVAKKKGLDLRDFLNGVSCETLDAGGLPVKSPPGDGTQGGPRSFADVISLGEAAAVEASNKADAASASGQSAGPTFRGATFANNGKPDDEEMPPRLQAGEESGNGRETGPPAVPVAASPAIGGKSDDDTSSFYRQLCTNLGIDVLGETESGSISIFSYARRTEYTIRDIDRLSYTRILQYFGPNSKELVADEGEEEYSKATVNQVRNAIGALAGGFPADDELRHGVGCWQANDGHGVTRDAIIAIGSNCTALCDESGNFISSPSPRSGRHLFKFSGESWFKCEELEHFISLAESGEWCESVIDQATKLFGKWRWKQPDGSDHELCPAIIAGLIMASFIQTTWAWRPQIGIIGESKTGKSILFRTLQAIFGPICHRSESATAAGIRQTIQTSASIMLCDEFEHTKHRQEIFDMLRASSRGGTIIKGTTGQKKAKQFKLQHIVWMAAIEIALNREPDKNRFITLELVEPAAENQNKLRDQPAEEMRVLGQKLLAIAMRHGCKARSMADRLKCQPRSNPDVDSRIVESYCVPAAMIAVACGRDDGAAGVLLDEMLSIAGTDKEQSSDRDELIHAILRSIVRVSPGMERSVSELLIEQLSGDIEALERHGIAIRTRRADGVKCIFFDPKDVASKLLRNTDWHGQSIGQILRRLPEAKDQVRQRLAGRSPYGVMIPWEAFRDRFIEHEGEGVPGQFDTAAAF